MVLKWCLKLDVCACNVGEKKRANSANQTLGILSNTFLQSRDVILSPSFSTLLLYSISTVYVFHNFNPSALHVAAL